MVISLLFLIVPLNYTVKTTAAIGELNLLTEGTAVDTIKTIKGVKYDLDSTSFAKNGNLKINHLQDLSYFLQTNPTLKKVNIYGYGLAEHELNLLKDYQVLFHPAPIPNGIIAVNWQKKIKASAQLVVQGTYNNTTNKTVALKLKGFGSTLDSVMIRANAKVNFSLQTKPKQRGLALFKLIALQDKDSLSTDPIPFEVEQAKPISILILASFPDFEYKFLKKWLQENQNPVAFRSQVSKDKFSSSFVNMKALTINQITASLLKNFDLVVIDEDELAAITRADRTAIYNAVNNGMGLLVKVTNSKSTSNTQNFNQYELISPTGKPLELKLAENEKLTPLIIEQRLFLKSDGNSQPLIVERSGKILVDSKLSGMGKIITSTLSSTFQWQLAGKQEDYSRFWSFLLDKSLRKKTEELAIKTSPQFPMVNGKTRIIISSGNTQQPIITFNDDHIAPRQNMELPFIWDGFLWAKTADWNGLIVNQQQEQVFIYQKTDWKALKNQDRLNSTKELVANQLEVGQKSQKTTYLVQESVNKWWFFFAFLFSISFLWYEQRFLAGK